MAPCNGCYHNLKKAEYDLAHNPHAAEVTERIYPGEALVIAGGQRSKAMADQIMAADKSRLKAQMDKLSKADMLGVEEAIKIHLALPL